MAGGGATQKLTEQQRAWLEHVRSWEHQGGTMKGYAESEGLSVQDFYHYKRLFSEKGLLGVMENRAVRFQQVEIKTALGPTCRVEMPNGARVELSGPLTAAMLGAIFKAAGALP